MNIADGYDVRYPAIAAAPAASAEPAVGANQSEIARYSILDNKHQEYEQDYNTFMLALHISLSSGVKEAIAV